jgi:hypothetical protein
MEAWPVIRCDDVTHKAGCGRVNICPALWVAICHPKIGCYRYGPGTASETP